MKRKQLSTAVITAACLLILIFDSQTALHGAKSGIDICLNAAIPSLFPFFVLSVLLTDALSQSTSSLLYRIPAALHMPEIAGAVLVPAFLGGYPVGAQCIGNLYTKKTISKTDAEKLLGFCSNAGPAFVFGMVSGFFQDKHMVWLLWFIHIFSAVITSWLIPSPSQERKINTFSKASSIQEVILTSVKVMAAVCSWIILFRTIIAFLDKWILWMIPETFQVLITGLLELANGCFRLAEIHHDSLRFLLCSCMLAFGGICIFLQTASVTKGLSLKYYLRGKILQTLFSFLLSSICISSSKIIWGSIFLFSLWALRKLKNRYSIPGSIPV